MLNLPLIITLFQILMVEDGIFSEYPMRMSHQTYGMITCKIYFYSKNILRHSKKFYIYNT